MSGINGISLVYKEQRKENNFDLLHMAYTSLLQEFGDFKERKRIIPKKKLYAYFGIRWRFRKETTKELLRAISEKYPVELRPHGLKFTARQH